MSGDISGIYISIILYNSSPSLQCSYKLNSRLSLIYSDASIFPDQRLTSHCLSGSPHLLEYHYIFCVLLVQQSSMSQSLSYEPTTLSLFPSRKGCCFSLFWSYLSLNSWNRKSTGFYRIHFADECCFYKNFWLAFELSVSSHILVWASGLKSFLSLPVRSIVGRVSELSSRLLIFQFQLLQSSRLRIDQW